MDSSLRARDEKAIHGVASHDLYSEEKVEDNSVSQQDHGDNLCDPEGLIIIDMLSRGQTINSDVYVETEEEFPEGSSP
jgi:hypothetical protein